MLCLIRSPLQPASNIARAKIAKTRIGLISRDQNASERNHWAGAMAYRIFEAPGGAHLCEGDLLAGEGGHAPLKRGTDPKPRHSGQLAESRWKGRPTGQRGLPGPMDANGKVKKSPGPLWLVGGCHFVRKTHIYQALFTPR
jgi:hypothetical protein